MDRPHSRPPQPIGEGGGGTSGRTKRLSQRNLQVLQASTTASHISARSSHSPGLPNDLARPQHRGAPTVYPLQRFTQGEAKEDPFPLYAKGAQNLAYDSEQCEQILTSAQGKRRERSASAAQDDTNEAGIKRHCSTSAGTDVKKKFACPYFKRFSRQSLPSNTCTHGFRTSTRVKEHLRRTHSLQNAGEKTPENAKMSFCKMMSGAEEGEIFRSRSKRNSSEAEKWTAFWRILFPDKASQGIIPSPYLDDDDDAASAVDQHGQLASFQARQYASLPERMQERCVEAMARRDYIDQPGVQELIDMLPELMRDVMKEESDFTSPNNVRMNTFMTTVHPSPMTMDSTTAAGYPELQAASTSQQQQHRLQDAVSRHEYSMDFNHSYKKPVGTTTDPGYFSADVESLTSHNHHHHHHHGPTPAVDDAENYHHHGRHASSTTKPHHDHDHDHDHDHLLPSPANNHPTYPSSGGCSGGAMAAASWMQQQPGAGQSAVAVFGSSAQQQDRSPITDFAGGWANEGVALAAGDDDPFDDDEEEFNLDDYLCEQGDPQQPLAEQV